MMCFQKINNNNYVLLCLGATGTEPSDIEELQRGDIISVAKCESAMDNY